VSFRPIALAVTAAVLLTSLPAPVAAQEERATLTGRVTDGSGGALPGVTVTVTAAAPGVAPVSVVTDGVGQYLSPPLLPGNYAVTFSLSGFAPETRAGVTLRPSDVFLLDAQLQVAQLTESVQVVAANPVPPPPPPVPPVKLEAPRRPTIVPLPKEVLASVCGPGRSNDGALSIGKLLAHRDEPTRTLYGNGDVLVLDVGADIGLVSGQNLVVRRNFRIGDKGSPKHRASFGEQTAGLIQLVEVGPLSSVAVVVYTCGELFAGDAVEPFDALPVMTAKGLGAPQFDDPAHIVLGEHGQTLGAARALMVIDRGTSAGAERGQRLTVFRRALGDRGPVQAIADAIIVAVRADSATIRIERTSDAVTVGDFVALHR
jgi:Carboxypeptidase regulatory-like domain